MAGEIAGLLGPVADRTAPLEHRTRGCAVTDDGQRLLALNEIFVGHRTHQSARYTVRVGARSERQSSSGLIVASGTGATGWARSIALARRSRLALPAPVEPAVVFFVREPWPSPSTGTALVQERVEPGGSVVVTSEMHDGGVCFGDGIESDTIALPFARRVTLERAETGLWLA